MALQHLRSSTASKRPLPASMSDGQLAINTNSTSPGLFYKNSAGALVKIGPVHVGTTAPNASPASGGETGNTVGEQWLDTSGSTYVFKIWDGSAWRSESGEFVNVTGDVMTGALGIIAGSAGSPGLYFSGDTNTGIYSPGADQVAISTNGTGRLFVDASGNVGVGIAPQSALHVDNGNGAALYVGLSNNIYYRGYEHIFQGQNGTTERMRLDSSGRLGLGSSSPTNYGAGSNTLTINGSAGSVADFYYNGTRQGWIGTLGSNEMTIDTASAAIPLTLKTNNTAALTIDTSQRVGIGTTTVSSALHVIGNEIRFSNSANASYYGTITHDANSTGNNIYNSQDNGGHVFQNSGAERVRIDSSGRLLVGTSTARANFFNSTATRPFQIETADNTAGLSVVRNSNADGGPSIVLAASAGTTVGSNTLVSGTQDLGAITFQGNDGTEFVVGAQISATVDGTPGTNNMPGRLVFSTTADGASSPTERMRITNAGHILFGTTDADADINGTPSGAAIGSFKVGSGEGFRVSSTGAHYWNFANDGSVHIFRRNGTNVGSITVSSGATAYNTSSDYRLKENVVPLTGAANRVNQLHVHRFNFIADPSKTVDGFIAHEAQAVVPECVTGTKDEVDDEGNPVYQGIDQSKLVPLLTAALQEALQKIEDLEGRLTAAGL